MTFGSDYRTQLLANSEIVLDSLPPAVGFWLHNALRLPVAISSF
jgi:protein-disulfide isomerase-like protein with CxxC motif